MYLKRSMYLKNILHLNLFKIC